MRPTFWDCSTNTPPGTIRLWNARTGEARKELKGHEGPIYALAWLADGKTLVSLGEKDGQVCVWQTDADKPPPKKIRRNDTLDPFHKHE